MQAEVIWKGSGAGNDQASEYQLCGWCSSQDVGLKPQSAVCGCGRGNVGSDLQVCGDHSIEQEGNQLPLWL